MFDEYELPQPNEVAVLDDDELVGAMALATMMETAAIEVRIAAMQEMYERQLRAPAKTRPTPPRARAAVHRRSRRRRRRQRKRKNRR